MQLRCWLLVLSSASRSAAAPGTGRLRAASRFLRGRACPEPGEGRDDIDLVVGLGDVGRAGRRARPANNRKNTGRIGFPPAPVGWIEARFFARRSRRKREGTRRVRCCRQGQVSKRGATVKSRLQAASLSHGFVDVRAPPTPPAAMKGNDPPARGHGPHHHRPDWWPGLSLGRRATATGRTRFALPGAFFAIFA